MLENTRFKKKVIEKAPKKKGRFGGGRVLLYSDPLQAFRANGANISWANSRYTLEGISNMGYFLPLSQELNPKRDLSP